MKEIVCDANIWYELGQNPPSKEFLKENNLIGTYLSIDELSRTRNLIDNYEVARKAIQALMKFPKATYYEPPLIYLKRLNQPKFQFNPITELSTILKFTKLIANGHNIAAEKKVDFEKHCETRKNQLQLAADFFNDEAAKIKSRIKDKEKHRQQNLIPLNRELISQFVATFTKDSGLDKNFDWSSVELFESVLKDVFNDLETGAITLTANDWYDLFNLVYVKPGSLYWTKEKKWINLITKAGMEKYLFDTDNNNVKES